MFDKLKKLFVEEDENAKSNSKEEFDAADLKEVAESSPTPTPSKKTSTPAPTSNIPPTTKPSTSGPISTTGALNDKFMDVLMKAIYDQNLPSFDYLEFKESLKSLGKMSMDEQTRFQSAFAVGKTMGATPKKLIDAANFYIKILSEEEKKFQQALVNRQSTQVDGGKQKLAQLEKNIEARKKQIEDLNKQIELDLKEREKLKTQVHQAAGKMSKTKNDFSVTFNHLVGQIKADIEKMQKYLK